MQEGVNDLLGTPTWYASLTLPGLAPTPGRISGPAERSEGLLGGDPPAGGPGKEAAQRQGSITIKIFKFINKESVFRRWEGRDRKWKMRARSWRLGDIRGSVYQGTPRQNRTSKTDFEEATLPTK
eukprot:1185620-Prorocentrum_minimum.AAC.1